MRRYLELLRNRPFARLWTGATVSDLGDAMTWVALVWLVFDRTGSARAVSLLVVTYTAPVLAGGIVMGNLLDRFDRRRLLVVTNMVLGATVGAIPFLDALGVLRSWHLFVVAGIYGLLKMGNLAGVPAIVPSLVPDEQRTTANAMESLSYWVAQVGGPGLAGLLIGIIGAPAVLALDAASYAVFVAMLARLRVPPAGEAEAGQRGLRPALRFLRSNRAVLAVTVMFMAFNVGEGMLLVLLPVHARETLGGGASTYGALLSAMAVAALVGSLIVGATALRRPLGRAIAASQAAAGIPLLGLLLSARAASSIGIVAAAGFLTAPLTIWAQTMRMRLIPEHLRGRTFGLLRTLMQSTPPIGAALAGPLLARGAETSTLLVMVMWMSVPGVVGLLLPSLSERHTGLGVEPPSATVAPIPEADEAIPPG